MNSNREELLHRLEILKKEHREIDEKIKQFSTRPYLTPDDQMEVARLKKLKLKKKDEIVAVAAELGVEIY